MISPSIFQVHIPDECFHHAPRALLQMLTRAGGSSDNKNGSYPQEDTATVTGNGGNGSGAPRMRIGRDPGRTWVTDGEKEAKETKIQECQISGVRLIAPLMLLDTHLPEIFSAKLFSEFPTGKRRCHVSDIKITVFQITCHAVKCLEPNRLSHSMWLGIGRNSFSPTSLFRQIPRLVRQDV